MLLRSTTVCLFVLATCTAGQAQDHGHNVLRDNVLRTKDAVPPVAWGGLSTEAPSPRRSTPDDPGYAPAPPAAETSPAPQPADSPAATLADLESVALANNPTLAQAAARLSAAQYRCQQVGLYPNPVVGYAAEDMGEDGRSGKQGAFVGQEFVTGGKLRLNRSVAAWAVEQARAALDAQRRRVLTDVRAGFYDAALSQRTLEVDRRLVRIGEEAVRTTQTLFDNKEVSRVEVLQARIEADSARLKLHDAEARHQAAWRRLAAVLGTPDMPPPTLAADLEAAIPQITWDEALAVLLTESPELQRARAGVEQARCQLQRERVEVVPNVDVRATVSHDNGTTDNIAGLELGLPIPLFNRNQGNIGRAQSELAAAISEVRRVELDLQHRLADAFERYAAAKQRADRYSKEILPNAQESLKLVQSGYRQGEFGYLTMLTAQRTFFSVSLEYLESLGELWAGAARIEGLLLEGSLRAEDREP